MCIRGSSGGRPAFPVMCMKCVYCSVVQPVVCSVCKVCVWKLIGHQLLLALAASNIIMHTQLYLPNINQLNSINSCKIV